MRHRSRIFIVAIVTLFMIAGAASAATGARFMEKLNRGLIAVKSGSGYYLSWRLFGTDPQESTFGFNIYKGVTKLNTAVITNATCYQDNSAGTGTYTVRAVTNGVEGEVSEPALVLAQNYLEIPLDLPAGYSANDASVGDLDNDGQYEIVLHITGVGKDNSQSGITDPPILDAYKLNGAHMWRINLGKNIREGAHYTQFLVYDFDGDGIAEVACKTAPGTKDATGNFLKLGPAAGADNNADYRTLTAGPKYGFILQGPEWYTIFNGKTGAELVTVDYKPPRGPNKGLEWGDSTGNRGDRFLACVAYLDGVRPSLVPCRGYYEKMTLTALDWRGGKLTERWFFSTDSGYATYKRQGNHNLAVGDVDGDGCDEIMYGACGIDHNGKGMYTTGLIHGDAGHLGDFDPDRPGLEYFQCHEQNTGISFRDAKTGQIIWEKGLNLGDVGRGCADHISASTRGAICWGSSTGAFDCKGISVTPTPPSCNFLCWWDGDLVRELLNDNKVTKYGGADLLVATGCSSINGTKSTPNLSADIFGDWREEIIFSCSKSLRIFTTTDPTTNRIYTLMHDPEYRLSIAWQNVAYNQPPHVDYYLGTGMTLPLPKPNIRYYDTTTIANGMPVRACSPKIANTSMKVFGDRHVNLPLYSNGAATMVVIYDFLGKEIFKTIVRKNSINLQKDFGMPNGLYFVRFNTMNAIEKL